MKIVQDLIGKFKPNKNQKVVVSGAECPYIALNTLNKLAIVGNPNVGKSVVFNSLTGHYAAVSNYPGTTVEVTRGAGKITGKEFQVIDTPGMYSLMPISEEERVARTILLEEKPEIVLQVIDAKNLERMLPFTLQLIEAGLPLILALNVMDEAENLGIKIDNNLLEEKLGIPVIVTTATKGQGIDDLKKKILNYTPPRCSPLLITSNTNITVPLMDTSSNIATYFGDEDKENPERLYSIPIKYDDTIEQSIKKIESLLTDDFQISKRSIAILLLLEDNEISEILRQKNINWLQIWKIVQENKTQFSDSLNYVITVQRQQHAKEITNAVVNFTGTAKLNLKEYLSRLMMHPVYGLFILCLVLYIFYEFVGVLGAQTLVKFLEEDLFGKQINPVVTNFIVSIISWTPGQNLFVHQYGIFTLAFRYALAIVFPIVTTFFIGFSIIEDTGYLPRLAMLIDHVFKKIGLNGRAVIPMVLGFGCDTMATMVTRILETKRERIIATFLLALAIPCSAQLGIILALLTGHLKALWIWITVMFLNFIVIGWLTAKIMPGNKPLFYMEIPPLRLPKLYNIFTKTYTRLEWYLKEIIPLFILASVLIWIGQLTGVFEVLVKLFSYPVTWIGLPKEAAESFLFGFFRRDYGAAGLYDLKKAGILTGIPLVVSVTTLALFVPCIAQFLINIKERGLKTAVAMFVFISIYAFVIGGLVNLILTTLRISL